VHVGEETLEDVPGGQGRQAVELRLEKKPAAHGRHSFPVAQRNHVDDNYAASELWYLFAWFLQRKHRMSAIEWSL
jgi:hypothetical protein